MSIDVSVIIPTYNGVNLFQKYLLKNIEILDNDIPKQYEIIITDDQSADESEKWIASLHRENIKWTVNAGKRGFSSNCNHGVTQAKGVYLFFLNNDIELAAGVLPQLIKELGSHQDWFSVIPRIARPLQDHVVESITAGLFRHGEIQLVWGEQYGLDASLKQPVLWACGAAFLCRRDEFVRLNGFDEMFCPYYAEDADLSMRAWRKGMASMYIPTTEILHFHNSTTKKEKRFRLEVIGSRNAEIYLFRHFVHRFRAVRLFIRMLGQLIRLRLYYFVADLILLFKVQEIYHEQFIVTGQDVLQTIESKRLDY